MDREFTCIVCPMGCNLHVTEVDGEIKVSGNNCFRGEKYAKQEILAPMRNISSTVRVVGGFINLCPVKTKTEIHKEKIFEVMKEIDKCQVDAPVRMGQIIIENAAGTGVDIVACRDVDKLSTDE